MSYPATDPDSVFVNRSDDTDDDYFGFAENAGDSSQSSGLSTNKYELEVLQFLEDARKDVAVFNSYKIVKMLFLKFNSVLPSSAPAERLFTEPQRGHPAIIFLTVRAHVKLYVRTYTFTCARKTLRAHVEFYVRT